MKRHFFFLTILLFIALSSCENSDIGAIIQPEEDKMKVFNDSFIIKAETELLTKRYSESDKMVLGVWNDPVYGSFRLDQVLNFRYNPTIIPKGAKGDSLTVVMYYRHFMGDSLSVQEASVYALKNKLDFETAYTSDTELSGLVDKNKLLGRRSYTAYDTTVPDSLRHTDDWCSYVRINLPNTLRDELISNPEIIKNQANFENFLQGIYVTNSYGTSTVLDIDSVNLQLTFRYAPNPEKPDSIVRGVRLFPANREVTEFISVSDIEPPTQDLDSDTLLYLVTSSGYAIHMHFPVERIKERLTRENPIIEQLNVNYASVILEENIFAEGSLVSHLMPPPVLLMIREADMPNFFTQSLYPAPNIQTVLAVYNPMKRCYVMDNMSEIIEAILKGKMEGGYSNNSFYLVPVSGATDIQGTNAVVRHEYKPFAVRLRGEKNQKSPIRMAITYTNL